MKALVCGESRVFSHLLTQGSAYRNEIPASAMISTLDYVVMVERYSR
jgi:hypothetical protein